MKLSRRAKRMQRHYARMHKPGGLNLVSLMDIFTILVFFLMVNSSDVKVLQQDKQVKLPESIAQTEPRETLVITLSGENILVQGRPVASLNDADDNDVIPGLKSELDYQSNKRGTPVPAEGWSVTLVADKGTPYSQLKRVMTTCTAAQYTNVSLAVSRLAQEEGA